MNQCMSVATCDDKSRGNGPDAQQLGQGVEPRAAGRLRVALLTNEIPPYRVPLYRDLAGTPAWDFTVFTCVDREFNRQWNVTEQLGFPHKQSWSLSYVRQERYSGGAAYKETTQIHLPIGVIGDLWRYRPDVVLSLEMGARSLLAAAYARLMRKRLVLYFEGTPHTERSISTKQRLLRRILRRACDGITCNGSEGRRYLESLGVPSGRIVEIGQATDVEPFLVSPTVEERATIRRRWGITGWCCLFSGQMIARKGIPRLLDAWDVFCRTERGEATLLLVGDGPERSALERHAADRGLRNVRFLGFIQREELPAIYRAADLFVFPSLHDCWALVIGEAMAAGLPVIDSKYNGGAVELIREGENGWIADPLVENDLAQKLRLAWECRDRKDVMGKAAQEAVARISIAAVAERIRRAVHEAAYGNAASEKASLHAIQTGDSPA